MQIKNFFYFFLNARKKEFFCRFHPKFRHPVMQNFNIPCVPCLRSLLLHVANRPSSISSFKEKPRFSTISLPVRAPLRERRTLLIRCPTLRSKVLQMRTSSLPPPDLPKAHRPPESL